MTWNIMTTKIITESLEKHFFYIELEELRNMNITSVELRGKEARHELWFQGLEKILSYKISNLRK